MHQRGIFDLTSTYVSAPAGNIGLDPDLWNVDVKVSQTNNQLPRVQWAALTSCGVQSKNSAGLIFTKSKVQSGLVAQIIKVKHFKVNDISVVPNRGGR